MGYQRPARHGHSVLLAFSFDPFIQMIFHPAWCHLQHPLYFSRYPLQTLSNFLPSSYFLSLRRLLLLWTLSLRTFSLSRPFLLTLPLVLWMSTTCLLLQTFTTGNCLLVGRAVWLSTNTWVPSPFLRLLQLPVNVDIGTSMSTK